MAKKSISMETLSERCRKLLEEYNHASSDEGMYTILETWAENKDPLIKAFEQHPLYNGNYQIVWDVEMPRPFAKSLVNSFADYIRYELSPHLLQKEGPLVYEGYTSREISEAYRKFYEVVGTMNELIDSLHCAQEDIVIAGNGYQYYKDLYQVWRSRKEYVVNNGYSYNGITYSKETGDKFVNMRNFSDLLYDLKGPISTARFASRVNHYFDVKAVEGQKVSRIIQRILKDICKVDDHRDYQKRFDSVSGGLATKKLKRKAVLSINPMDYLTQSFGNDWASCHTIDKANKRRMPNCYSGQYCSGTLSYMLDGTSLVFYLLEENAEVEDDRYELVPKINRNMFHVGKGKVIQSRIYPQANDGATEFYDNMREPAIEKISELLGLENSWETIYSNSECDAVIVSKGTHYRDYHFYDGCNVNYYKGIRNHDPIVVGHAPICPDCGNTHSYSDTINCPDCKHEATIICEHCGCEIPVNEAYQIDGNWYCEDCVGYCGYHGEYELLDDLYWVDNIGEYVCEAALNYGDYATCERCGEIFYYGNGEGVVTEDGSFYCYSECAERDGYRYVPDRGWYSEDEVSYCDHCEEYFFSNSAEAIVTDDGNVYCCSNCAEAEDYIWVDNADGWFPADRVYTCVNCGELVLDDDYDEERELCTDCAERLNEEDEEEAA